MYIARYTSSGNRESLDYNQIDDINDIFVND